ncbi:acyl-CoA thioesterase [Leptotrichia sp. HSP-334]|uniref:Acyl-CoA thioesterase n=1 Tax=Leptotrichia rugosa TaxID=3239302 RepID=A0AB39VK94_9FUSO|nr:thioesterase family protein [Leptotrichia sp. oral taxon 498]ASQ49000.1 thioesterase [Leptotrichia sp. oral taxon 498]
MKSFKLRIYYYDTDKMGVVYHSNYLKWMEIARTEYFRDILPYKNIENMGFILPVKSLNIEYIDSAKYDDEIEIFVKIEEINSIKIKFYYEMYDSNKVLKAKARTVNVFVDKNGKLKRISKEMLEILKK